MQKDFKVYAVDAILRPKSERKFKFKPAFVKLKGVIIDQDNLKEELLTENVKQQLIKIYTATPSTNVDYYTVDIISIELANKNFIFHTKIS